VSLLNTWAVLASYHQWRVGSLAEPSSDRPGEFTVVQLPDAPPADPEPSPNSATYVPHKAVPGPYGLHLRLAEMDPLGLPVQLPCRNSGHLNYDCRTRVIVIAMATAGRASRASPRLAPLDFLHMTLRIMAERLEAAQQKLKYNMAANMM